jgi:protein scribble
MFKCIPFARCNRHVEAIDKRHQNLTSFPDDIIRYYRTLEELLLDSNQLHELPKGFYKLTQLRKLDISDNEIEKISSEIGNFVNLVEFDCNRNDIQELPDSIKYCRNLQVLDISNNPLQSLPSGLTQLRALTELTLNDLSLPYLPEDIGNLVNLRSLQGRDNLLKNIPDSLCSMQKLESLDLGSNEIEEIPSLVGKLSNLKVLWLDLNQLKSIPTEIGKLKKLQYLELSENMLETLPEEISGCVSLTDINLAQNSIEYLPSSIGHLSNLSILKLEQNQLVVLTSSIGQCSQLSELVLTENLLSEIPASIGNLKYLTNLNVDRNRLTNLPEEICECQSLGLLFLRDNQLIKLPEEIGKLQKLRVLDVAGNKLAYLPYSLSQANLNAIWLAENQATGKIKLQPDFDEESQKEVLTCYLLPQQNFYTPSMENLLQGSINTAENSSQAGQTVIQQQQQQHQQQQQQIIHDDNKLATSESVRFAPEPDNDDRLSHFVRTNTPHPKELMKKKEALKQRHGVSTNSQSSNQESQSSERQSQLPVINTKTVQLNANPLETNKPKLEKRLVINENLNSNINNEGTNNEIDENHNNENDENINDIDDEEGKDDIKNKKSNIMKHVDFKLNNQSNIQTAKTENFQCFDNEDELNENNNNEEDLDKSTGSGHCRLRRRDTPHHLKGARINNSSNNTQQLDPSEMKEILERYSGNNSFSNTASPSSRIATLCQPKQKPKPATSYIPDNFKYDELRKLIQLVLKINRQEGAGLGIRIAGGKGSNPYKEDDDGIFITRILPDSPARNTGLKVGDKLLKVNQISLNDLTHQEAADALKEAVKSGTQLTLCVLQELDLNKLFFLQIPSMNENEQTSNDHPVSGFRINYNFSTYQQQEVEIIFVADQKRFGQLNKGDILLQINGINVDSISEKDLNKFIINSSNSKSPYEFRINYLTVYRPFVEDQMDQNEPNQEDQDDGSSQQDNENQYDDKYDDQNDNNNNNNNDDNHPKSNNSNNINSSNNGINHKTNNANAKFNDINIKCSTNLNSDEASKSANTVSPISSSTPMKPNGENQGVSLNKFYNTPYEIEEIRINKINGAMGLSIVGGGNVACHPFGVDKPGIFISKIVPDGAASKTSLKVGDRILKVNDMDVTQISHDDAVEELKRHPNHVLLLVSHDPQPSGLQEIVLHRSFPEETLGIRINGGIENKSANIFDAADEGIFVVNIINGTLAQKDGRLQIGTRIMEVSF